MGENVMPVMNQLMQLKMWLNAMGRSFMKSALSVPNVSKYVYYFFDFKHKNLKAFPDDGFYYFEDKRYCLHDYQLLYAPICQRCQNFVEGEVVKVSFISEVGLSRLSIDTVRAPFSCTTQ